MRLRRALLIGTAVAVTGATSAVAPAFAAKAPIKYCNILTDQSGDGQGSSYATLVESPALDVLSADIATGKSELVAVLRVGKTNTSDDQWIMFSGYEWSMGATLNGVDYTFELTRPAWGGTESKRVTVGNTSPAFTFAVEGNSFVWRVKRSALPSLNKKPGQSFTNFRATTDAMGSSADTATAAAGKKYPDKGLSCVKAR